MPLCYNQKVLLIRRFSMYIDSCIAKNLKTNWNDTLSIHCGIDVGCPELFDIYVVTETIEINFTVSAANINNFDEKLSLYLPYNKDFLLSLDSKTFEDEYEIEFPKKSKEQDLYIDNKIKNFVKRGDKNNFKDYLNLKSGGKDKYSAMKLDALKDLVDSNSINEISKSEFDEKHQAVTHRWGLRELPVDIAIHKVKVDLEVMSNIRKT